MTDKELKGCLRKLIIGLILIVILIAILLFYTLGSKKADLSIYTNAGYADKLQTLGIDESEFREYLAIFGNLIDSSYDENQKALNMAVNFIETMYSSYEETIDENGYKSYDADLVKKVVEEMSGAYVQADEIFTYNELDNTYTKCETQSRLFYCTDIEEITKNGDEIEVTYDLDIINADQVAEYSSGQLEEYESHKVKVILMKNEEYEYSKYFVINIEEI